MEARTATAEGRDLDLELLPGQARGLDMVFRKRVPRVFLIGGVGGGKTKFAAIAATLLAYENPGCPGGAWSPTYTMLADIMEPTLEEFWEEHGIPYRQLKSRRKYTLPECGSEVWCRSADRPRRLVGTNLAWIVMDEVCLMKEGDKVLQVAEARVRHPRAKHLAIVGATTPNGFDFLYDKVANPEKKNPDYDYVHASSRDNSFILRNDPRWVERLLESYDTELAEQEIDGRFLVVGAGGRPYSKFEREVHLVSHEFDPGLPLVLTCDFNVDPMTWEVGQDPGRGRGRRRVIDEIETKGALTEEACREFLRRYPKESWQSGLKVYGDASGNNRKTTGPSDWEVIRQLLGVVPFVHGKNPHPPDRCAAVNAQLKNAKGEIGLEIHKTKCPRLVTDLEQVRFIPGTREIDKRNPKLTHASDALGYWIHWEYPVRAVADAMPQRKRLIDRMRERRTRRS